MKLWVDSVEGWKVDILPKYPKGRSGEETQITKTRDENGVYTDKLKCRRIGNTYRKYTDKLGNLEKKWIHF